MHTEQTHHHPKRRPSPQQPNETWRTCDWRGLVSGSIQHNWAAIRETTLGGSKTTRGKRRREVFYRDTCNDVALLPHHPLCAALLHSPTNCDTHTTEDDDDDVRILSLHANKCRMLFSSSMKYGLPSWATTCSMGMSVGAGLFTLCRLFLRSFTTNLRLLSVCYNSLVYFGEWFSLRLQTAWLERGVGLPDWKGIRNVVFFSLSFIGFIIRHF